MRIAYNQIGFRLQRVDDTHVVTASLSSAAATPKQWE